MRMRRALQFSIITAYVLVGGALLGCAGGSQLQKIETQALPDELPSDIKEKFEIREEGASKAKLEQTPVAKASPTPAKKGKKELKADTKKEAAPAPATAFAWPNRRPAKDPIWLGEKMVLEISYFGMSAGDLSLEVMPYKEVNNRKVYHVKGLAQSSSVFSVIYRVRDTVESFIDYQGIFSHRFHLELDETKQTRTAIELNDAEKGTTFYWNRWNHVNRGFEEKKITAEVPRFAQDSISAVYYVRTQPLEIGKMVPVPIISEGKHWTAEVHVVRREECRTPMGSRQCLVLKPETRFEGVLQKRGDSFIWITDDDRRVVVKIEAKVRIGTVNAKLRKFEPGTAPQ
jgi:hypothetical protein